MLQWQCGFRVARSTLHAIAAFKQTQQYHQQRGIPLHCVFIDAKKAFDMVDRAAIDAALQAQGVHETDRKLVQNMLEAEMDVRGQAPELPFLATGSGVRQGCPASPVYFVLAMDAVLRKAGLERFNPTTGGGDFALLGYADDLVVLGSDPAQVQRNLDKVLTALASVGLHCNIDKTKSMSTAGGGKDRLTKQKADAAKQPAAAGKVAHLVHHTGAGATPAPPAQAQLRPMHLLLASPNGRPTEFECPCCAKRFGTRPCFQQHMQSHGWHTTTTVVYRCQAPGCGVWCSTDARKDSGDRCRDCYQAKKDRYGQVTCDSCKMRRGVGRGHKLDHSICPGKDIATLPRCTLAENAAGVGGGPVPFFSLPDPVTGVRTAFQIVNNFLYLGEMVYPKWSQRWESMKTGMNRGHGQSLKLKRFLRETNLSSRAKALLIEQRLVSVSTYACETWCTERGKELYDRLNSLQYKALRWAIGWQPKVRSPDSCTCQPKSACKCKKVFQWPRTADVLSTAGVSQTLADRVRERQRSFAQNVLTERHPELVERAAEQLVLTTRMNRESKGATLYGQLKKLLAASTGDAKGK